MTANNKDNKKKANDRYLCWCQRLTQGIKFGYINFMSQHSCPSSQCHVAFQTIRWYKTSLGFLFKFIPSRDSCLIFLFPQLYVEMKFPSQAAGILIQLADAYIAPFALFSQAASLLTRAARLLKDNSRLMWLTTQQKILNCQIRLSEWREGLLCFGSRECVRLVC